MQNIKAFHVKANNTRNQLIYLNNDPHTKYQQSFLQYRKIPIKSVFDLHNEQSV